MLNDPCDVVTREQLLQRRRHAGLSQAAVAARLGITQSEVSKYERGERALDETRLRSWLRVLSAPLRPHDPPPRGRFDLQEGSAG